MKGQSEGLAWVWGEAVSGLFQRSSLGGPVLCWGVGPQL